VALASNGSVAFYGLAGKMRKRAEIGAIPERLADISSLG
jgi:hypothetical protein